jgi:hypothetical protein
MSIAPVFLSFTFVSIIIALFSFNIMLYRAQVEQVMPSFQEYNVVFALHEINNSGVYVDTNSAITNSQIFCYGTLDCLSAMNKVIHSQNATHVSFITNQYFTGASTSSQAVQLQWQASTVFKAFFVVFVLTLMISLLMFVFILSNLARESVLLSIFLFISTGSLIVLGVIVHDDVPFGAISNIVLGLLSILMYAGTYFSCLCFEINKICQNRYHHHDYYQNPALE